MGSPILEIKGGKELRIVGTKSSTFIIGWIAFVLGILMDGIFYGINAIGLPYVGLAIILFTIVIYLAMTPLQVKMQRFSKMTAVIQPEVEAIQAKYKNKKDPDSQQKQMDETQAVYRKYGVSPTGSCVQLFIQMPVLFALYEVLNRIPGYITLIGNQLTDMVNTSGFSSFFNTFVTGLNNSTLNQTMTSSPQTANYVDTLYKLNSKEWASLLQAAQGQDFLSKLQGTHAYVTKVTDFLSLNISDSPMAIFTQAWSDKAFLLMLVAILFPILAWLSQWMNYKLMPQPEQKQGQQSAMQNSMKSMNTIMPVISAVFCFTLPVGLGIYWVAGAVVRMIQQLVINKSLDKENIEDIVAKNEEKVAKKAEKKGVSRQAISRNARINTRSIDTEANQKALDKKAELAERLKRADEASANIKAAEGSLASKANMVAQYDERNAGQKRSGGKKK